MQETPKFEFVPFKPKKAKRAISIERQERAGGGYEVEASRATLHYTDFEKQVNGLILRKFRRRGSNLEAAEYHLNMVLEQWKKIIEINRRRQKEGKTIFCLPGTIRGYRQGNEKGILMTDLSKGEKFLVSDVKSLNLLMGNLSEKEWQEIRAQIEKDIQIAEEERIKLAGGPFPLDPWLIVFTDSGPVAYITDIGDHTSVNVSKETAQRSTTILRKSIEETESRLLL